MNQSILLINDITCYGKVGSQAMQIILNHHGIHSYVIPTAIYSNTLDYGDARILDTSKFMEQSINQFLKLGVSFDIICIGLVSNSNQIKIIKDYIDKFNPNYVMLDPIMADDGQLYPELDSSIIQNYKNLAQSCDLIIPNITEAKLLTNLYRDKEQLDEQELFEIGTSLKSICPNLIITSCNLKSNKFANLILEKDKRPALHYYEKIKSNLVGTGDVFAGELISQISMGKTLLESVKLSHNMVHKVITNNTSQDPYNINIECAIYDNSSKSRENL